MNKSGFEKDWFKHWFGKEYIEVYAHRNQTDAQQLIQLIRQNVAIVKRTKILDAGCGNGRHACLLKTFSDCVVGLDLSAELLHLAKQQCQMPLVRGDIRALPFKNKTFDLVLSLFTSFGYFESDEQNKQVLQEYHRVLTEQGMFVLDFLNAFYVRSHLKAKTVKTLGGKTITEERRLVGNHRVVKTITIEQGGQQRVFYESVRLFTKNELQNLFKQVGFKILKIFGTYEGAAFNAQSPRLILVAQKMEKNEQNF